MELIDAAYHGDDSRVKSLLECGADVRATNQSGYTALHWATCQRHTPVVASLLDKGADVNAATQDGRTALHFAVEQPCTYASFQAAPGGDTSGSQDQDAGESAQLALLKLLLSKNINLQVKNVMGRTALHLAAAGSSTAITAALLQAGADIEAADIDGMTPLMVACAEGRQPIVKLLIDNGANVRVVDEDKRTPLQLAAARGDEDLILMLVAAGADIQEQDQDGGSVLHMAAQGGHLKLMELLLAKGLSINHQDKEEKTPLHNAAEYGQEAAVAVLLKKGAQVDAVDDMGETPLHLAAKADMTAAVAALIKGGADLEAKNTHGRTPLHVAAADGAFKVLETLQLGGAKLEAKDDDKSTPLILASNAGHEEATKKLLQLGADANAVDMDGLTALHLAVLHSYTSVVKVLLKAKGINLDAKDKSGRSAVHIALVHGSTHLVNMLTQAGAKLDETKAVEAEMLDQHKDVAQLEELLARCARVDEPYIPHVPVEVKARKGTSNKNYLHDGARSGNIGRIKMGLAANHSMYDLDDHGRTPLHLAAAKGYHVIVDYLLRKGAIKTINALIKKSEETALHLAAKGGTYGEDNEDSEVNHLKVLRSLLKNGADPNIRTKMGRTALHLAVQEGYKTVVRELLETGKTDVNVADTNGQTPLHMAVVEGFFQTTELLLSDYNILKNAKDRSGKTPLDLVEKMKENDEEDEDEYDKRKDEMKLLLRRYGCSYGHEPASNMTPMNAPPPFGYSAQPNYPPSQYNNPYPPAFNNRPSSPTFSTISSISSFAPGSPRSSVSMPPYNPYTGGAGPMFRDNTPNLSGPIHNMGDYIALHTMGMDHSIRARIQAVDAGVRKERLEPFLTDDGAYAKPTKCVQATRQVVEAIRADTYFHTIASRTLVNRMDLAIPTFSTLENAMQRHHVDSNLKLKIFGYVYPVLEVLLRMGEALRDMSRGASQTSCIHKMNDLEEGFKMALADLEASRTISSLCRSSGY